MVRSLRESLFGQIFLGAIVVAIILAFALTGSTGGPAVVSDCAVEVGTHCVSPKDFQASYGLVTSIGINEKAAKSLNLKEQVARGLAEREVLLDQARSLSIATSESDINTELAEGRTRVSLPARGAERLALNLAMCVDGPSGCAPGTIGLRSIPVKVDGAFNYDRYKRTIRVATGRSPGHFKEAQQKELTADRVRDFYRAQVQVSEEEAFLAYRRARSQATARIARINAMWFGRYIVSLSDEQVENWASANEEALKAELEKQKDGFKEGCPLVSEIRLSQAADDGADPTKELEALKRDLRSPGDFARAARERSIADSALLGGQVGCLDESYGPVAEVLSTEIEGLSVGQISGVVSTVLGPTILRIDGFVTKENRDESMRRIVARRLATEAEAKEAARAFAATLIEKLGAGEPIVEATEALIGATLATSAFDAEGSPAWTTDTRPTTDISRQFSIEQNPLGDSTGDEPVAKLVFDLEKPDDVVSKPLATAKGFAVLQLKEKDIATREDFAEDRELVVSRLRARKAEELVAALVDDLIERAGGVKINRAFIPLESEASGEPEPAGS